MIDAPATLSSTAYCQAGRTASGAHTFFGEVAMNTLPLHTRIYVRPAFYGRHRFTVLDRIGFGSQIDLFVGSCTAALTWGRRPIRVTSGWPRRHRSYRAVLVQKRMVF